MENKMTDLLQKAFDKASELPTDRQDVLARQLLEDIEDEQRWTTSFANSEDKLARLADKALEEFKAGKTQRMGWDEL
jgi:hypothetical protein